MGAVWRKWDQLRDNPTALSSPSTAATGCKPSWIVPSAWVWRLLVGKGCCVAGCTFKRQRPELWTNQDTTDPVTNPEVTKYIISIVRVNYLIYSDHICTLFFMTTELTLPHGVFMCFVWIWEQTAIISLYNVNWLVCITETECVYCAVRTGYLYIILRSAHTLYLCVLCGSQNKQRLFPYTALTDWFL